ncbi:MAG: Type 1 glutamine amidotransferase-like domain-containing protein [Thermodesulfobacteriota bacterium]
MASKKGIITLMGSGEFTATMVEVHKELFSGLPSKPRAFFLDTPAGFEPNADQISQRAVEYFETHVQQALTVASFKGKNRVPTAEAVQIFQKLRGADYVLVGPGSPTYALRQWRETLIPDILVERIEQGGCLVAASAAALTLGRYTLPVYEIYKVGQELHWVEGINILAHFGFNLVVIPHWNNAEGQTHDTRFCFMGEERQRQLEALLPEDVGILGLDEHTACILDLGKEEVTIKGLGGVTLRYRWGERVFKKGEKVSLRLFQIEERKSDADLGGHQAPAEIKNPSEADFAENALLIEKTFLMGLENFKSQEVIGSLLEFERLIWKTDEDLESREFLWQARRTFQRMILSLGGNIESFIKNSSGEFALLTKELIGLRQQFRKEKKYEAADAIRKALERAGVIVEDTLEGARWRFP